MYAEIYYILATIREVIEIRLDSKNRNIYNRKPRKSAFFLQKVLFFFKKCFVLLFFLKIAVHLAHY